MKPCARSLATLLLAAALTPLGSTAAAEPALTAHFVPADSFEVAEIRQLGENAINRLAVTLTREVTAAIAKDGPEAAVDVCHLKSLTMTNGTVAGMPRITATKRTSLKLRNPANAPDAAEQLVLDHIKRQMENGDSPSPILIQRIESPAPEWRVYKPLGVAPKCMTCHGDPADQPPGLRAKLDMLYPLDQARDYSTGEWRGVIRVTVADAPAKKP